MALRGWSWDAAIGPAGLGDRPLLETLAEARRSAAYQGAMLRGIAPMALAEGWADQATLDAMLAESAAWAERPDAFPAAVYCHAVGWVGE
jgi:hypothetical protein